MFIVGIFQYAQMYAGDTYSYSNINNTTPILKVKIPIRESQNSPCG